MIFNMNMFCLYCIFFFIINIRWRYFQFFFRIYLKGPKAGHKEVFTDNLPGYPDNIKRSQRGTFFVGLTSPRFHGSNRLGISFLDAISPYPAVKRFIGKVQKFTKFYGCICEILLIFIPFEIYMSESFSF